jgi:hypothetical protein
MSAFRYTTLLSCNSFGRVRLEPTEVHCRVNPRAPQWRLQAMSSASIGQVRDHFCWAFGNCMPPRKAGKRERAAAFVHALRMLYSKICLLDLHLPIGFEAVWFTDPICQSILSVCTYCWCTK